MTRRERAEARLERRREWARKRAAKADASIGQSQSIGERFAGGQPVILGHHSTRRALSDRAKMDAAMQRGVEHHDMAQHHAAKADGIEAQLARTIFSDDPDAIEALRAKIARLTQQRDEWKRLNAWWRKHGTMAGCPGVTAAEAAAWDADIPTRYTWERKGPIRPYELTNIGGTIRAAEKRIAEIERRQGATAKAEAAGGVTIERGETYARVVFAEKPDREIIEALRASGFRWNCGAWLGLAERLPACVEEAAPAHAT